MGRWGGFVLANSVRLGTDDSIIRSYQKCDISWRVFVCISLRLDGILFAFGYQLLLFITLPITVMNCSG